MVGLQGFVQSGVCWYAVFPEITILMRQFEFMDHGVLGCSIFRQIHLITRVQEHLGFGQRH